MLCTKINAFERIFCCECSFAHYLARANPTLVFNLGRLVEIKIDEVVLKKGTKAVACHNYSPRERVGGNQIGCIVIKGSNNCIFLCIRQFELATRKIDLGSLADGSIEVVCKTQSERSFGLFCPVF